MVPPHLLWQVEHGWPTLELLANAKRVQHQPVTPVQFVWGQIQLIHPFAFPIWMAGLVFYLRAARGDGVRFLGWTYVVLFVAALLSQAKTYYLAPAYPMLLAGGSVAIERWTEIRRRWLRPSLIVLLLAGSGILAPYVLPILPVETVPEYVRLLGMTEVRPERRAVGTVPQLFADMLGWPEVVAAVGRAHASLPPAERARAAIWSGGYGDAGAVDFFGRTVGLPRAISGYQNYYLWGPGEFTGEVAITVGISGEHLRPWFESVEPVETVRCDLCMPDRAETPIHIVRGLKIPVEQFWPMVKCWTCDLPVFAAEARQS